MKVKRGRKRLARSIDCSEGAALSSGSPLPQPSKSVYSLQRFDSTRESLEADGREAGHLRRRTESLHPPRRFRRNPIVTLEHHTFLLARRMPWPAHGRLI
jgi:hypothetical protein